MYILMSLVREQLKHRFVICLDCFWYSPPSTVWDRNHRWVRRGISRVNVYRVWCVYVSVLLNAWVRPWSRSPSRSGSGSP